MRNLLIKRNLFLLLLITGLAGCSSTLISDTSEQPFLVLAENQNYCDGIPVFEIYYPGTFKSESHRFSLFQINENGRLILETYLSREDGLNSSYLCLDKKFLKSALIFITYGSEKCGGNVYEFKLNDFEMVSKDKKSYLDVNCNVPLYHHALSQIIYHNIAA